MRCGDVLGKQILSLDEAARIGITEDVVFDLEGKFVAFVVRRPGPLGRYIAILADQVEAIGPDAITAQTKEPATPDQVAALKGLPTLRNVRHTVAMTSRGAYLGPIDDLVFDPDQRRVAHYLIRGSGLLPFLGRNRVRNGALPANGRVRFGRHLTIFWEDELIRLQPWPSPQLGERTAPVAVLGPATVAIGVQEADRQ